MFNLEIVGERYGVPTEPDSISTVISYFTDAKRKSYSEGLFKVYPKDDKKDQWKLEIDSTANNMMNDQERIELVVSVQPNGEFLEVNRRTFVVPIRINNPCSPKIEATQKALTALGSARSIGRSAIG